MSCRTGDLIVLTPPTYDGFLLGRVTKTRDGLAVEIRTRTGARITQDDQTLWGRVFSRHEMNAAPKTILKQLPERFCSLHEAREALRPFYVPPEAR